MSSTIPAVPDDLVVDVRVPERAVHLEARIQHGVTTAVLGPNGAGKSTLLGAIAGTVLAEGSVRSHGMDLLDVPIRRREIAYLAQRPVLFTHMSALANVAYGLRARGMKKTEAQAQAEEMLSTVGMAEHSQRMPQQLSGGQAQRVALARALITDPEVVLLDEPFAALDTEARTEFRTLLRTLLAGRTALVVTHDLLDVMALGDRVLVLDSGRVVQHGGATQVLKRPRTQFLAHLAGITLVTGTVRAGHLVTDGGLRLVLPEGEAGTGAATHALLKCRVMAAIDPSAIELIRADAAPGDATNPDQPGVNAHQPEGTRDDKGRGTRAHSNDPHRQDMPGAVIAAQVTSAERWGSRMLLRCGELAVEVPAAHVPSGVAAAGRTVQLRVPPHALSVYAERDEHEPSI